MNEEIVALAKEAKELAAKATEGPWYFGDLGFEGAEIMVANVNDEEFPVLSVFDAEHCLGRDQIDANWDFCAYAREAVPALADAVLEMATEHALLEAKPCELVHYACGACGKNITYRHKLEKKILELEAENARLKKAINSFGNNQNFDWDVLGKLDDLEVENARLRKIEAAYYAFAREGMK